MSLAPSLTQASPVRHGRTGRIALWAVQIALAGMFLLAGGSKLLGAAAMVGLFDAIGMGSGSATSREPSRSVRRLRCSYPRSRCSVPWHSWRR